jgi:hypothetical protein
MFEKLSLFHMTCLFTEYEYISICSFFPYIKRLKYEPEKSGLRVQRRSPIILSHSVKMDIFMDER